MIHLFTHSLAHGSAVRRWLYAACAFTATTSIFFSQTPPSLSQDIKFHCSQLDGKWRTFMETSGRREPIINWLSFKFGPEYNPRNRCIEVTNRFRDAYRDDRIAWAKEGYKNGYPVVCAPFRKEDSCASSPLLFTLEHGEDPAYATAWLDELANSVGGAKVRAINLSTGLMSYDSEGNLVLDMNAWFKAWEAGAGASE